MAKANKIVEEKEVDSLDVVIKSLAKSFDDALIGSAKNILSRDKKIIPTSLQALNKSLGNGGFVGGRVAEFYGEPGSGKSTAAFDVIKNAQQLGMTGGVVDAEHTLDLQLLESMGVDVDKLIVGQGYYGEENLDIAEALIKSGKLDVLAIDSVTALMPMAELEADFEKSLMGNHARLISKAAKRFVPLCAKTNCLLIFINQFRLKMDGYGDPRVTTGGISIPFFASYRLHFSGGSKSTRIMNTETGSPCGHRVTIEVIKNKLAPPFRSCEADLFYGKGFDSAGEVVDLAVDLGIIEKKGSWYAKDGVNLAQGTDNLKAIVMADPAFYEILKAQVKEKL